MLIVADPVTRGELLEQGTIEPARHAEVGVLDDCVLPQSGLAQSAAQPLVLAARGFPVEQQAEPVLTGEITGRRIVLHVDERVGHRSQAEAAQALGHWVDQHGFSFSGSSRTRERSRGTSWPARLRLASPLPVASGWRLRGCTSGSRARPPGPSRA